MEKRISITRIIKELEVTTARSGGPGGQHVNKVETKVQVKFDVLNSKVLSDLEKEIIKAAHHAKLSKDGCLLVAADSKRSQLRNKELAFKKLDKLLAKAFQKKKKRKPTTPSKAAKKERLDNKKKHGEKKTLRKKIL